MSTSISLPISPDVYRAEFGDPATSSWSVSKESDSIRVVTPNNFQFDPKCMLNSLASWEQVYPSDHASTRLWVRSLWYCVPMTEMGEYQLAQEVIESYLAFLRSKELDPARFGMNSLDHCLALNVRAMVRLLFDLSENQNPEAIRLRDLAYESIPLLFEIIKKADFFLLNNHGLMLTLAILHGLSVTEKNEVFDLGFCLDFLKRLFDEVVSEEGFVYENTPVYQRLWVSWASETALTLDLLTDASNASEYYRDLSAKIEDNLRYFVVDEASILPIGDGTSRMFNKYEPRQGEFADFLGGQYVLNLGDGTVVSYTSGFKSAVHKHVDDQAVRFWYKGQEILADAGFVSYDINDPLARCVTSQRGHSIPCFKELDRVPAQRMYPWDAPKSRVKADLGKIESSETVVLTSTRTVDDRFKFSREVIIAKDGQYLAIRDCVSGDGSQPPVARFLVPAAIALTEVDEGIVLEGDGWCGEMRSLNPCHLYRAESAALDLSSVRELGDDEIYGISAKGPNFIERCHVVEFEMRPAEYQKWTSLVELSIKKQPKKVFAIGALAQRSAEIDGYAVVERAKGISLAASGFYATGMSLSSRNQAVVRNLISNENSLLARLDRAVVDEQIDLILFDPLDEIWGVLREQDGGILTCNPTILHSVDWSNVNKDGWLSVEDPEFLEIWRESLRRLVSISKKGPEPLDVYLVIPDYFTYEELLSLAYESPEYFSLLDNVEGLRPLVDVAMDEGIVIIGEAHRSQS